MSKQKNISKTIKPGAIIITRDEFLEDHNGFKKEKYLNNTKLYREMITVETNRKGHLAAIKIQSGGKFTVTNKAGQIEKYNPYIKTKDDNGKPIQIDNKKFARGNSKYDVSKKKANEMKRKSVRSRNLQIRTDNRNALRELKERKKRKP